jgi:ribosome-binding factor A
MTGEQILQARDIKLLNERRAELQKRLSRAAPWLAGQLTRRIGLRYAPELRFYLDTTMKQVEEYERMAAEYIEEVR